MRKVYLSEAQMRHIIQEVTLNGDTELANSNDANRATKATIISARRDGLNPDSTPTTVSFSNDQLKKSGLAEEDEKDGIKIDPKNKGKFNATKERTGKSTEELKHSKNPLTRKRAVFADNAKKWKKGVHEGYTVVTKGMLKEAIKQHK